MIVEIGGKKYSFEVNGTVGLTYIAERYLKQGETLDISKSSHIVLMYYAALLTSNKEFMPLDNFLAYLTVGVLAQMTEYFNERWKVLDPQLPKDSVTAGDNEGNA